MNILVTGGAGYIGSVVVDELVSKHKVIVYDDLSTGNKKFVNKKSIFVNGSILDLNKLLVIFKKYKINAVIHLAAKTVVGESVNMPAFYYENNVIGTFNLLKTMVKSGCKKIIFASSAAVYGNLNKKLILESEPKNPCNPYGSTKLCCESMIHDFTYSNNLKYCIYRFFNVSGASKKADYGMARDKLTLLIPLINQSIILNKKFFIFGKHFNTVDKTALRDYVHVLDLANAIILGLKFLSKNKSCCVNLCSNKGYTVKQVYDIATKVLKKQKNFMYKPSRAGDPDVLVGSNKKSYEILKWKPKYNLVDMIKSDYLFRIKLLKKN